MAHPKLNPGITGSNSFIVERRHLTTTVGSGKVTVFSTAMLIGGMEGAAVNCVEPFLEAGETTVGIHVNVNHDASTPLGMKVSFQATLQEISANGKILTFRVEASDELGKIGEGLHKRAIVNKKRFEEKTQAKLSGSH